MMRLRTTTTTTSPRDIPKKLNNKPTAPSSIITEKLLFSTILKQRRSWMDKYLLIRLVLFGVLVMLLHPLVESRSKRIPLLKTNDLMDSHINEMITNYQQVAESIVTFQTASWFRYIGAYKVEDTSLLKATASKTIVPHQQQQQLRHHDNNNIQWDDEKDIPQYFQQLIKSCSMIQQKPNEFTDNCLEFLYNLVQEPKCTVQLDSRYICSSGTKKQVSPIKIFKSHFTKDTINIIIIGGGPVGLFLANALTILPQKTLFATLPEIKIVVFENRIDNGKEGRKLPYSRTWMTGINKDVLAYIDEQLQDLFQILFDETITLPINFWETLLLLSNRKNGVKFIYGSSIKDYEQYFQHTPNLLMFDATGHRLQKLERNSLQAEQIITWGDTKEMEETVMSRWQFDQQFMQTRLPEERSPLKIAIQTTKSGTLLYPVLHDSNNAYSMYRFDICSTIPLDAQAEETLENIEEQVAINYTNENYGIPPPFQGNHVVNYSEGEDSFRHFTSLQNILEKERRTRGKYFGIHLYGYSMKLTKLQGRFLQTLIHKLSNGKMNVPWSSTSMDGYIQKNRSILKQNFIGTLLQMASRLSSKRQTKGKNKHNTYTNNDPGIWANTYVSKPYMYKDPMVTGGYKFSKTSRTVPLLRLGNSLFSGDTDISSGLQMQLLLIQHYQCKLLKKLDCHL